MEVLQLFITASIPVLKVLLITALGSYLALDHVNILGEDTRKHLNTVVFYVMSPALVSSNLARTITYESMVKLWFMPVNILITFIFGSILGWILLLLTRPPAHLRGLVLGCCAAGNLGNLLLIIVPAVCKEKGSPFGAPDVCRTYGLAYASLSTAIGAIYLWSYVYNIVRISAKRGTQDSTQSPVRSSTPNEISCTEPLLSSKESEVVEENANHYALPCTITEENAKMTTSGKIKQRIIMVFGKLNLKTIFAPSTTGAIVGFSIGVIPQIRKALIGDGAPLRVVQDTASLLGDGAIPTLTLIIGGNLLKGLRGPGMQKSLVVGIIIVRFVALPLIGILVIKGALKFGLVHSDPLYLFVLLLQFSLPPAMNIGTMTQLFGAGEKECSVIMLWTYAFASVSLTFWSAFFMWLVARL
ncbi:protein PIN-LIKES 3-like [Prunus avium]|uniref:Protein PIN-LIKES 3-like n=1 Tax=Prunus avium TaxID=42229 RepID=A0A6P5SPC9_PRUAV|nr:protein PIN-LIKES 3-like [Prunus avium]